MSRIRGIGCTLALSFASVSFLLTTGCGMGDLAPATPLPRSGPAITGHVHGGQQPVAGAHVYLFGVRGDIGDNSLLGKEENSSGTFDLLDVTYANAAGHGSDALGNYVLTDSNGLFTLNGTSVYGLIAENSTYLCNQDEVLYILAVGGNPGVGSNNPVLYEMADLGPCPGSDVSLSPTLNVSVSEVSTVAAVYALSGYMTGPTGITFDNTALGSTGITNASANVNQLVSLSDGTALSTTPNGAGTVPAATINTLADIMASCINSTGATTNGAACGTLFANATSDGTTAGTQPTETVTAMLNIAHHPAANVSTLFGLATPKPAFGGGLVAQPNDFTLSVGLKSDQYVVSPGVPAVDANGNVWFPSTVGTGPFDNVSYSVEKISPLGDFRAGQSFLLPAIQVAVDPTGDAWVTESNSGELIKIAGTAAFGFRWAGSSNDDGHQIAIDASGNVFISDYTNGNLYEISNSGSNIGYANSGIQLGISFSGIAVINNSNVASYLQRSSELGTLQTPLPQNGDFDNGVHCGSGACVSGGLQPSTALAVDVNAHVWTLNNNSSLSAFDLTGVDNPNTGGYLPGSPFSGGDLNTTTVSPSQPYPWLAIDGGGNVWVANYTGSISEFSNSGAPITPDYTSATQPGGYFGSAPTCKGQGLAIDGSGDVWVSCDNSTVGASPYPFLEYIGAAVPVYTPLTPGHFGVKP